MMDVLQACDKLSLARRYVQFRLSQYRYSLAFNGDQHCRFRETSRFERHQDLTRGDRKSTVAVLTIPYFNVLQISREIFATHG